MILDELEKLSNLREQGAITQREFNAGKAKLLAGVIDEDPKTSAPSDDGKAAKVTKAPKAKKAARAAEPHVPAGNVELPGLYRIFGMHHVLKQLQDQPARLNRAITFAGWLVTLLPAVVFPVEFMVLLSFDFNVYNGFEDMVPYIWGFACAAIIMYDITILNYHMKQDRIEYPWLWPVMGLLCGIFTMFVWMFVKIKKFAVDRAQKQLFVNQLFFAVIAYIVYVAASVYLLPE